MVIVIFRWLQKFESSGVFWIELPLPSVSSVSWQGRRHNVVYRLIIVITPYTLHSLMEMIHILQSKLPWMGCEAGSLHDRHTSQQADTTIHSPSGARFPFGRRHCFGVPPVCPMPILIVNLMASLAPSCTKISSLGVRFPLPDLHESLFSTIHPHSSSSSPRSRYE